MTVLLGVILLFALMSLVAAAVQAAAMIRLAPAGAHLASFLPLGWWKFGQLESRAGPAASAHLSVYKRAVIAFLVFLVLGAILSGWTVNRQPALNTASIGPGSQSDLPYFNEFRRVAPVPGAPVLES